MSDRFVESVYRLMLVAIVVVGFVVVTTSENRRQSKEVPYDACRALPDEELMADCIVGVARED